MGLIEYYLIFAISTAIVALLDFFNPALADAEADGIKNVFTENPKLAKFVYFILTILMAPLIIMPLLVPSMNERFRLSLTLIIREAEE